MLYSVIKGYLRSFMSEKIASCLIKISFYIVFNCFTICSEIKKGGGSNKNNENKHK